MVAIRQLGRIPLRIGWAKRIMHSCHILTAHDRCRIQGRLDQQSRIGEARVAERRQTLQRGSEHPAKVIVEQGFGVRPRPLRVDILAALLQVSLVEAAEASLELRTAARRVGNACVRTCSYRWSPYSFKKNIY